jgi:hypothetical protein
MQVIANWSQAHHNLFGMIASLLKLQPVIATIMFQKIENQGAQRAAILGALEHTLSKDDFPLYRATLATTESSQRIRNEFAHHLWGTCTTIDALLLLDPKDQALDAAKSQEWIASNPRIGNPPKLDFTKISVYTKKDLLKEVRRTCESCHCSSELIARLASRQPRIRRHTAAAIVGAINCRSADPSYGKERANCLVSASSNSSNEMVLDGALPSSAGTA